MSFGGFMGFMSAFWAVMNSVRGTFSLVPELSRASGMVERLHEFEELQVDLTRVHHADSLQLDRISFSYDKQIVFSDLQLEPKKGERILSKGRIMQAILEATEGKTLLVIMHGDSEFHGRFDRVLDLTEPANGLLTIREEKDVSRLPLAAM